MKKFIACCAAVLVLALAAVSLAAQPLPDLKGVWATKTEGGILLWESAPGKTTHWEGKQSVLTGELEIKAQNGRVLTGEFRSAKASEPFIGVIGLDGVSLHFADQDGTFDGTLKDKDTIEVLYRHVTPKDTVVAVGVWTRKK